MDTCKPTQQLITLGLISLLYACGGGGGSNDDNSGGGTDSDSDGIADVTDIDDDNDGLIDIATLEQLDWMRNDMTGATLTDHNSNVMMDGCPNTGCQGYELMTDLDFDTNGDGTMDTNDTYFDYDGDGQNNGWLPVGNDDARFVTTFEGNGYSISNLYIERDNTDVETMSGAFIGLFGLIDGDATTDLEIRNLVLDGDLMQVTGGLFTGGLVGVAVNISITNTNATGKVAGTSDYTGGLVGQAANTAITGSYATGRVTGNGTNIGGLAGWISANTTISNSYATGDVTGYSSFNGGLVGLAQLSSTITNSYATGNVTGNADTGGLVGWIQLSSTIENSYATGNVTGTGFRTGGLVGLALDNATVTGSYATGDVSGMDFTGGLVGSVNFRSPDIQTNITTINNSFATGAVSTSGSNNYVGGLIGISYHMSLNDSFATGAITNANQYVGGLIGDANAGSVVNRSFAANMVTGGTDVGGLVGYSDTATYANNYFTSDSNAPALSGVGNAFGAGNVGATTEVTGDTLVNLQAVITAGAGGFNNWTTVWDFGTSSQLPGLIIDGVVYRDGDAKGELD